MIKRDGQRQRFDRTKLRAALLNAAHKRPVTASDIEAIVDRIETAVQDGRGDLSSERVGQLCLAERCMTRSHLAIRSGRPEGCPWLAGRAVMRSADDSGEMRRAS